MTEQLTILDAPRPRMTETALRSAVADLARLRGWRCYWTFDSRRSPPGYPDLTLVSAKQRRVVWIELKDEHGRLTGDQHAWLLDLDAAGAETGLWRPHHLRDGVIDAVLTGTPTRWRTQ